MVSTGVAPEPSRSRAYAPKAPAAGLNTSIELSRLPPMTWTFPSGSTRRLGSTRATCITLATRWKRRVAGSKSSAESSGPFPASAPLIATSCPRFSTAAEPESPSPRRTGTACAPRR